MKRIFLLIFTTAIMLTLCSCEVHFFSLRYDVPWWVIAIPTVVVLLLAFVIGGIVLSKKKYICPNCNNTFSPKWYRAGFSIHFNSDRVLKCPHCKSREICHVKRKKKSRKPPL